MKMLLLLGVILIVLVVRDVFHSVVPRGMSSRFCLAPFFVHRVFWPLFCFLGARVPSAFLRTELLSLFAPFALLSLLMIWLALLVAAFGFITLALASHYAPPIDSLLSAVYVAAASFSTISSSSEFVPKMSDVKFLMLAGSLAGLLLTASALSLMVGLIAAIQPREAFVSVISNLGGATPSGIAILETYSGMHGREHLPAFFDECHHWCADVLESHRAYPILPYFRSNDSYTSWLTALGAVLDSIALMLSGSPDRDCFSARMVHKIGSRLVNEFASLFKLVLSEADEIGDEEFHQIFLRLEAAGYVSNSENAARESFRQLRSQYLPAHRALTSYLAMRAPT